MRLGQIFEALLSCDILWFCYFIWFLLFLFNAQVLSMQQRRRIGKLHTHISMRLSEGYDSIDSPKAITSLKYMLLCKIMLNT